MIDYRYRHPAPDDGISFTIIGWGWVYRSTVLNGYSRYIIAWKLCTTMRAEDVTDTLDLALAALKQRRLQHRRIAA